MPVQPKRYQILLLKNSPDAEKIVNRTVTDVIQDRRSTALHLAIRRFNPGSSQQAFIQVARCLIQHKAILTIADFDGKTVWDLADAKNLKDVLQDIVNESTPAPTAQSAPAAPSSAKEANKFTQQPPTDLFQTNRNVKTPDSASEVLQNASFSKK